jgi:hypothetical protein
MKISMRMLGAQKVARAIRNRQERLEENLVQVVNDANERIFSESQRRVPVDTGNLKASGRMTPARAGSPTASTTYGGTAAAYAAIVHEIHPTKNNYLVGPAREIEAELARDARNAVKVSV